MRYTSIDVLRTMAIFMMVLVHFLENLAGATWSPAGLGAPMFGFLVGVSYQLWVHSQVKKDRSEDEINRASLRRGLFVFGVGFVFNIAVWLPADTFNWDVLTLIGTALVLIGWLRDTPDIVPVALCMVLFVMAPILRIETAYQLYWQDGYFDLDWKLNEIVLGYLVNGYFPVFPWLIFPLVGLLVGKRLIPDAPDWTLRVSVFRPFIFAAIGLIGVSLALRFTRPYQTGAPWSKLLGKWTMFPPSVEYMTGMVGVILLVFILGVWLIDMKGKANRFPRLLLFVQTMSKYSFTVYVLHHLVHVWPLWLAGYFSEFTTIHYWRQAMSWEYAVALVFPCMLMMYGFLRWIDKRQWPTLESMLRKVG
jgi:uncharacterized membrane protein